MYRQLVEAFLYSLSRYLCNKNSDKMSAIGIHFCRVTDCEMLDRIFNYGSKMFDKLFATTNDVQ
jgi:hypothetical protein